MAHFVSTGGASNFRPRPPTKPVGKRTDWAVPTSSQVAPLANDPWLRWVNTERQGIVLGVNYEGHKITRHAVKMGAACCMNVQV